MKRLFVRIVSCLVVAALASVVASAQQPSAAIHIWDGTPVKAHGVTLTPYLPAPGTSTGAAVVVCPGGSYHWLDITTEGHQVARDLSRRGIAAFVLKYRVAGVFAFITHYRRLGGGNRHPMMVQDVQRAIELVRERAAEYGVDEHRVGVMGFSAGGHQALMAAAHGHTDFLQQLGIQHTASLYPDFIAPIYPVVSMTHPCTHRRSRRGLMSERHAGNKALREYLSMELHAASITCPVFILNCKDDPVVDWRNSQLMADALDKAGVKHLYVQYPTGGHGFGTTPSKTSTQAARWLDTFILWLKDIGIIN